MSKSNESDDLFLKLFFEIDNTYSVINSKSEACRNVTTTTAEMIFKNQWFTGLIKFKGYLRTLIC